MITLADNWSAVLLAGFNVLKNFQTVMLVFTSRLRHGLTISNVVVGWRQEDVCLNGLTKQPGNLMTGNFRILANFKELANKGHFVAFICSLRLPLF